MPSPLHRKTPALSLEDAVTITSYVFWPIPVVVYQYVSISLKKQNKKEYTDTNEYDTYVVSLFFMRAKRWLFINSCFGKEYHEVPELCNRTNVRLLVYTTCSTGPVHSPLQSTASSRPEMWSRPVLRYGIYRPVPPRTIYLPSRPVVKNYIYPLVPS